MGPPVSSTNKTDHHNIHKNVAEILLKVALSIIKQSINQTNKFILYSLFTSPLFTSPLEIYFKTDLNEKRGELFVSQYGMIFTKWTKLPLK